MKGKDDDKQIGKSLIYNTNTNGPNVLDKVTPPLQFPYEDVHKQNIAVEVHYLLTCYLLFDTDKLSL